MYKCLNCGEVFGEPKVVYETHGFPCPPYQKIYVCPRCKDDYIKEVEEDDELEEYDN